MEVFYLGTHQPHWLADPRRRNVPLFVSHRRLGHRRTLPRAVSHWALDSGGFTELRMFGEWRTTPAEYIAAVRRYDEEIGKLGWAAPQDWMCEPDMLARTGLTVAEHQRRTVANYVRLRALWYERTDRETPIMPVVQGWTIADYLRCVDMYGDAGVDLVADVPVVGVGSVCRRQGTDEIGDIFAALHEGRNLLLHGFGVKAAGLRRYSRHLLSCVGTGHRNCANCLPYALGWRDATLTGAGLPEQLRLTWEVSA